jgi:hypothetical protein
VKYTPQNKKAKREALYLEIYNAAVEAGNKAAAAAVPTPMVVQQHENMADDNSPVEKQWIVPDGVCGFAWVVLKPANHSFAKWMKANGLGRTSDYGGLMVWPNLMTQSMTRKEAWAHEFAKVIHEITGIKAYAQSRMD